jgi:hypothetical protein
LAAWRAAQECTPPHRACRHTPAPGKAAGGPRREFLPQAKSLTSRLWQIAALKWFCFPPAGPLEAHAKVLCRRRRRRNYGSDIRRPWRARRNAIGNRLELAEGISPRGINLSHYASAEQGRRRPTPRFCAAGAGGVTTFETFERRRRVASAIDCNSPKVHRREGQIRSATHLPSRAASCLRRDFVPQAQAA